ncbi:MerR family transcriptional regulator [Actinosynnema sp. NPDC020468]|uniref:MerR family transcriptional regulator n=1 Tax=Actinosynnema sp. NPDC020468 TaxID=3154488 RepID=UPI0033CA2201
MTSDDPRSVLTIGRLAAAAGVTVRAVRHYHQVGLLPEPERDASGYRRYGPQDVVALIRIRTLAAAGVPLARVHALLRARPAEFAAALADLDADLRDAIGHLAERRRLIADLAAGDRLLLPPEVVAFLNRLRRLGAGESRLRRERDSWILARALDPGAVRRRLRERNAALDDPETARLLIAEDRDG